MAVTTVQCRLARALLIAGLCLLSGPGSGDAFQEVPVSADTRKPPSLIKQIRKLAKQLKQFYEWIDWSEDAIPKLKNKQIPPPPPGCPGNLDPGPVVDELNNLEYEIVLPEVTYLDLPKPALRETRDALSQKFGILLDSFLDSTDAALLTGELDVQISNTKERWDALDRLSKPLLEIAKLPLPARPPSLYFKAVACFGAIELTYKPWFAEVGRALEELRSRIVREEQAKADGLQELAATHKRYLLLEAIDLGAEQKVQEEMRAELSKLQEDLRRIDSDLQGLQSQLASTTREIESRNQGIRQLQEEISDYREQIERNERRIENDRNFLAQPYNRCPSNPPHPYETCNHTQLKAAWDQEKTDARNRIESNTNRNTHLRSAIDGNKREIGEHEWTIELLRSRASGLLEKLENLRKERAAHVLRLQEATKALWQRALENPVAQLLAGNEQEQRNLTQLQPSGDR